MWAAFLSLGLAVGCSSTEPLQKVEGTWVLRAVNGSPLPFDYSYTTTEGQLIPGLLLADTLTFGTVITDHVWADHGAGPTLQEDFLWVSDQNGNAFIMHLPDPLAGSHQATLTGGHLEVRIADGRVRAGLYDFTRAP